MDNKIALVVASSGYQPVEYGIPKKVFEHAGCKVKTISDTTGMAHAKDGTTTPIDGTLETLNVLDYDAIIFVGGSGALEHLDNDLSYAHIQDAAMAGIVVGAICSATRIVAKAGVLEAKRATGWDGDGQLKAIFDRHGVIYSDEPVITDGLIVTAQGPKVAEEFAHAVLSLI